MELLIGMFAKGLIFILFIRLSRADGRAGLSLSEVLKYAFANVNGTNRNAKKRLCKLGLLASRKYYSKSLMLSLSSDNSCMVASILWRLKSSTGRFWTILYLPSLQVTGKE